MDTHVTHASFSQVRLASLLLLVIVCTGLFFAPERSQAEVANLVTCPVGTHTATWSPGVTNTAKTTDVVTTSNWGPCVLPSFPLVVSASSIQSFQAPLSCQSLLLQTSNVVWIITWSDGVTSTYTFNTSFNTVNGLITAVLGVGTITDGRFKDATALSTFELVNFQAALNNSCGTTTGVTGVSGLSTLVITP